MGNIYKSEKATWEGDYSGVTAGDPYSMGSSSVGSFSDLLDSIKKVKTEAINQGLTEHYFTQGKFGVHNKLSTTDYNKANQKARSLCMKAKRFHKETVQNIDSKFTTAMSNTIESLNKVNEGKNKYETKSMTYKEEKEGIGQYGETYKYTVNKKYSLDQIVASKDSPIKAARDVYKKNLSELKEQMKTMDDVRRKELEKFSDDDLMKGFFGSELGEFEKVRSSFHEKYGKLLGYVDGWGTVALGILAVVSGPVGWGVAGMLAGAALVGYSGAKLYYGLSNDESMINGSSLGNTDKVLLAAGFLTSVLGFNNGKLLNSIVGQTESVALTSGQTVSKWALSMGVSDVVGFVTNPIGKITEKALGYVSQKTLQKIVTSVVTKVNFKGAVLNEEGLGTGKPRNVAKFSDLRADEQAKMKEMNKLSGANLTDDELLIAYKNVDFTKPNLQMDKPGVGFQDYKDISEEYQLITDKIKGGLKSYNSQFDTDNIILSKNQVKLIDAVVVRTVKKLSKDTGNKVKDIGDLDSELNEIGIPEDVRKVIVSQLYGAY
ncbi:hypothetical protein [Carnobacterium maltaromaticum]|uniref:hypothetical protein n=1 Tax=Carnobacterium maltaromaticum TaxID=2751 RepID=UPI00295ECBE1|nr:hypothetical protein [Carnobacterium maltaromaticum]